eukprot:COSAG06_NODE_155_length_21876_cov_22.287643_14_plen_572_part_00
MGEDDPPVKNNIVYGGEIDDGLVHHVVFRQVQITPLLTYRIEVQHEIYFSFATLEIIRDISHMTDTQLQTLDNWFGDSSSRHRGIEATFVHNYSGVLFKVIFHTPASYRSSVEIQKAMADLTLPASERDRTVHAGSGSAADTEEKFRRHCALLALHTDVTVPPRCLTIGEVRYSSIAPRGVGADRLGEGWVIDSPQQPQQQQLLAGNGAMQQQQQQQQQLQLPTSPLGAGPSSPSMLALPSPSAATPSMSSPRLRPLLRRHTSGDSEPGGARSSNNEASTASRGESMMDPTALAETVAAAVKSAVSAEMEQLRKIITLQQSPAHTPGETGYSRQVESIARQHGIELRPPSPLLPTTPIGHRTQGQQGGSGQEQDFRSHPEPSSSASSGTEVGSSALSSSTSTRRRKHRLEELRSTPTPPPLDLPGESATTAHGTGGSSPSAADLGSTSPLRAELQDMRISALRKRALSVGVAEHELDAADESADRKSEIIKLVMITERANAAKDSSRPDGGSGGGGGGAREEALRAELAELRPSALRERARDAGVSAAELDEADDQDDCRSALVELIVRWG